jgi:hypothetical protein
MVTFQIETWDDYQRDCRELWQECYTEYAQDKETLPFVPDEAKYATFQRLEMLQILTARLPCGRMVAYCITIINRHMHHPVKCGFEDSFYIAKAHRKIFPQFVAEIVRHLRAMDVKKFFIQTIPCMKFIKLFEALDFELSGFIFSYRMGA